MERGTETWRHAGREGRREAGEAGSRQGGREDEEMKSGETKRQIEG